MIRIIISIILLLLFILGLWGSIDNENGNLNDYILGGSIIFLIPSVLFLYFGLKSSKKNKKTQTVKIEEHPIPKQRETLPPKENSDFTIDIEKKQIQVKLLRKEYYIFPKICTCCLNPTDSSYKICSSKRTSSTMVETNILAVPHCKECRKHFVIGVLLFILAILTIMSIVFSLFLFRYISRIWPEKHPSHCCYNKIPVKMDSTDDNYIVFTFFNVRYGAMFIAENEDSVIQTD